jgi:hypothetical protein
MKTFQTFANVSGLHINLNKSDFLPIVISENLTLVIENILKCETLTTPIQYLELLLTIKKPPKSAYLPLINVRNMERKKETYILGRTTSTETSPMPHTR